MLIWLVLRLILGDIPKQLQNNIRLKLNKRTELRLITKWRAYFLELYQLIDELIKKEWKNNPEDDDKYLKLRVWFRGNREIFLKLWKECSHFRTDTAGDYSDKQYTVMYEVLQETRYDPFSYFYSPIVLPLLIHNLEQKNNSEISYTMVKLLDRLDEFIQQLSK